MSTDLVTLVDRYRSEPRIGATKVRDLLVAAGRDGRVDDGEKDILRGFLQADAVHIDPEGRRLLRKFVAQPFALPATQAAFTLEQRLAGLSNRGDVSTIRLQALANQARQRGRLAPEIVQEIALHHGGVLEQDALDEAIRSQLGDGRTITRQCLVDIEASLCRSLSSDAAQRALLRAARTIKTLPADAALYLRYLCGNSIGFDRRNAYLNVLQSHLPNAQILDLDGNGEFNAGDVVTVPAENGSVRLIVASEALANRVRINAAIVEACEDMDRHRHEFGTQNFKSKLWEPGDGCYTLARGARPSQAIADICERPGDYTFECLGAIAIVYYKAMLSVLGDQEFDRRCPRLKLGPGVYDDALLAFLRTRDFSTGEDEQVASPGLWAGQYRYVCNTDVSVESARFWRGENTFFLGGDRYYGHPFNITTESAIMRNLNKHRRPDATIEAHFCI